MDQYAEQLSVGSEETSNVDPVALLKSKYQQVVKNSVPSLTLVKNPRYTVSNESLKKLRPGVWLNDELINAYVSLVNSKLAATAESGAPRMMCLNSWFMPKLESEVANKTY